MHSNTEKHLTGIDQFGRVVQPVAGYRENRTVGMFYWFWMGQPMAKDIYDATKIMAMEDGRNILYYKGDNPASPNGQAHWWGEPLLGYYNCNDEWVLERHMEMIGLMGVDFIYFDTTNAVIYPDVFRRLLPIIVKMRKNGFPAPQVAFYTHSRSLDTIRHIYNSVYKPGFCPEAWYMMNGKPFIIGYQTVEEDLEEAALRSDNNYNPEPLSEEILDFFYFKKANWPFDETLADGFPWIEWHYPAPLHDVKPSVMSVSVASHPKVPMSFTLTRGLLNWGRGYDPETQTNVTENSERGTFYQLNWDRAIETDPDIVSLGGWNEWIAYKQLYDNEYMLCDACDLEFSRDIEPMKGGYEDAFYLQSIENIRRYKGEGRGLKAAPAAEINLHTGAGFEKGVRFTVPVSQVPARDALGAAPTVHYKEAAPRNQIKEVTVAHDENYVYFKVECENAITAPEGSNWMNIFIGTGEPGEKGWNSYEFVANRTPGKLETLKADFTGTEADNAEISCEGNTLLAAIERSALGLFGSPFQLYFKVSDGVKNPHDIMDTYLTGRSFPMGRLSLAYKGE